MQIVATLSGKVSSQQKEEFVEVRIQRGIERLLQAQVFSDGARRRFTNPLCGCANIGRFYAGALGEIINVHSPQLLQYFFRAVCMPCKPIGLYVAVTHYLCPNRRQQPGISTRLDAQVQICHLRGLGTPRVHHDHLSLGICLNFLQNHARPRKSVRLPWVRAKKYRNLGMLKIFAHMGVL